MTHDDAYPRLPDLLAMRLADQDDAELRAHLAQCEACRRRMEQLRRVAAALGRGEIEPVSEQLARRVEAIPERYPQEVRSPRRVRGAVLGVAALALVAVATVAVAFSLATGGGGSAPGEQFAPVEQVALSNTEGPVEARLEMGELEGSNRPLRLTVGGLPVEDGRFELWLKGPTGSISVGTFRPDQHGSCVVVLSAPDGEWTVASITTADGHPRQVAAGPM